VRMCWIAQNHMFRFIADSTKIMSSVDMARYGNQCRVTMKQKLLMATIRFGMRARTMLPGYTPHQYVLPENIAELSAHYTQIAQSIR
jgi:hypothetical protein